MNEDIISMAQYPLSVAEHYSGIKRLYSNRPKGMNIVIVPPKLNSIGLWDLAYMYQVGNDNEQGE